MYFSFFASPSSTPDVGIFVGGVLWFSFLIGGAIAQVYRYRRVSTAVERQQTRWVVYSVAVSQLLLVLGLLLPSFLFPPLGQADSLYNIVSTLLFGNLFFALLLALSLGIAILRYRLYDIDILINRTLVYGTLTALLAAIYFGLVLALQSLLHGLTGQGGNSPFVVICSTLVIAALFQPLRRRIQQGIDRRFYRRKYNAAQTLNAFSAALRNEIDLSEMSEHLLAVVQETMQPTHVSLWLRPVADDPTSRVSRMSRSPASLQER